MLNIISNKQITRVPLQLNGWGRFESLFKTDITMYKRMLLGDISPLGSNFLHSLINTYGSYLNLSPFNYAYDSNASVKDSIVPDQTNREVITNLFYDTEVSVYLNDEVSIELSAWEDMEPVKIIYHSESRLSYFDFTTEQVSDDRVYVVINTSQLFYMYALYMKDNKESGFSISHFLTSYVFPNIVKSYINICIWNTMVGNVKENEVNRLETPIPQHLVNEDMSKIYDKHLDLIKSRKEGSGFYLKSLPLIDTNALSFTSTGVGIGKGYKSVFEILSRLPFALDVWRMMPEKAHDINYHYMKDLEDDLRRLRGYGLLKNSVHLTDHLEGLINEVKEIVK